MHHSKRQRSVRGVDERRPAFNARQRRQPCLFSRALHGAWEGINTGLDVESDEADLVKGT